MMARNQEHISRDRLDHLCLLVTDGTHDSPKLQPSGVPFIKGKHISSGFVDFDNCDYITLEDHEKAIQRSKPEYGDILFSNIGSVGDTAYINTRNEFSIKNVALFKPNPRVVDSKYLYYVAIGPKFKVELFAKRSGVAQQFFSLEMLRGHEVEYHRDLNTQRKIAAILSAYDDLIENNLRRIKILEEMAQNLYREWFVKFRFPGHLYARFTDSSLGRIPEGWEVKALDQVALFQNKGTDAGEHLSDRVYLPIDCIPRRSLAISEINSWKEAQSSLHLFDEGDILFGAMRPYFHKVVVAPFKGVTRKTCFVFKSVLPEYHAFTALTLFQDSTISFANAHSKGATIPYAVWPQSMDGMPVVVPSIEQANRFEDAVGPMIARIGTMFFQNTTLHRTRDLLLPRLISGEVDVSELDIAVPVEAVR
jgi:type I restriction enzyme S subunit